MIQEDKRLEYFDKLIKFATNPEFIKHIKTLKEKYDKVDIPHGVNKKIFLIDNLIFDIPLGEDKKTVLDQFILSYTNILSSQELEIYKGFKKNIFSCFQVTTKSGPNMIFQDIVDEKEYCINDAIAINGIPTGKYVIARILPFENYYVLTGACAVFETNEKEQAINLARKIKILVL